MSAVSASSDRPAACTAHPRQIGWLGTTALAMGGSNQSLFLIGALVAGQGSAAIPLLMLGLLLSYAAAFGWTELILMWPNRVGGIAASCAEAFRPYSPVLANLTGVCYWWGWIPTCGLTAILSASALHEWYLPFVPVKVIAIALVVACTLVNLRGIRLVTRLAIPIATVSAALAFLSALVPVLTGHVDWRQATTYHLTVPFPGPFGGLTAAMAGLYLIGFGAPAFEAAACHVGETIDPVRNVPRAMLASAAMAAIYFAVLPVVWLGALGTGPLHATLLRVDPTFAPILGSAAHAAALWFMMVNMFHGTLQPLAGAARTLMQLAEDGLLPRLLAWRNGADSPWVATWMTAGMAILFLLSGDPTWVIAAANLCYLIGIALPNVAVWLLRRNAPHMTRPYRAPRGTIALGLLAAAAWGVATVLGFEQFGLPTVLASMALAYSGSLLYAWRRWSDRRRLGRRTSWRSLHVKLTGAMLVVLVLDGTGYLLAVNSIRGGDAPFVVALEDIFVAVALLTVSVGLVLPGMISHAAGEVARAADRLATGTLADLSRAMVALSVGDLDAAQARAEVAPVVVYTRDEVGAMATSFNTMQDEVAQAAMALHGARDGLRQARDELRRSNDELSRWGHELESRVGERTAALQEARAAAVAHANQRDAIFDSITDGIVMSDLEGQVIHANVAARMLLGLDEVPPDGVTLLRRWGAHGIVYDEQGIALPPERWPLARILRGEVLNGAGAVDVVLGAGDHALQLSVSGAPVRDQRAHIVGGVMVLRDVTQRSRLARRTHESLHALVGMAQTLVLPSDDAPHASEAPIAHRLAEMARSALDCRHVEIVAVDADTELVRLVAAAGRSSADTWLGARTLSLSELVGGAPALADVYAGETPVIASPRGRHGDVGDAGRLMAAPMQVGPHLVGLLLADYGDDPADKPEGIRLTRAVAKLVGLVLERERLLRERAAAQASELALRESNRRMDDFLSIAAHELRTPLTTLLGYVQLVQKRVQDATPFPAAPDRAADPFGLSDMLSRTGRHILRLDRLVNDLLDVSRIQADRLDLQLAACNVTAIVQEMVQEQRRMAPARAILMDIAARGPVPVCVDADRIGQVVTNYLTNALKYAPPDRPIVVGVQAEGMMARVWVHDEGPGLPADEQEHVWERFYRVDGIQRRSGSHVGLGLGLHICHTIVARHGGQVGVDSEPNRGSTFWFTVPLARGADDGDGVSDGTDSESATREAG